MKQSFGQFCSRNAIKSHCDSQKVIRSKSLNKYKLIRALTQNYLISGYVSEETLTLV